MINPLRKLVLATGAAFLISATLCAQGVRKDDFIINQAGKPIPNASVTICPTTSTGVPCSPTATIYADAAETTPLTQPLTTGPIGNFGFYATPGEYIATVTGSTINSQTLHYSIPCTPSATSGCGGGGGTPGSPVNSLQFNSSGNFAGATGITTPDGNQLRIKGPGPFADVTASSVRAMQVAPQSTCTISATSKAMSLPGGASTFQNGDGIDCRGAGATLTLSTPASPSVTPSLAIEGTGLGGGNVNVATVAGGAGSSSYSYEVIYRDIGGGYTAPSAAGTTGSGAASLGPIVCNISTITRSNTSITINFTGPCPGAVQKARMFVAGVSISDFFGPYNISTVNSSTQVVVNSTAIDSRSEGWLSTDGLTSTGGTATFYASNHLNFTYQSGMYEAFVCAERPGDISFKLIGTTKPSTSTNGGFRDLQFDDYGSPYNDNQNYPIWMTNAVCNGGSAMNDTLVTTITAGGGSTSLTVNDAATNSVTAQTAIFDNGPNILTAANTIKAGFPTTAGTLYFPPTPAGSNAQYIVNSYTSLPAGISIKQAGAILLNDTLQIANGTTWDGSWANVGVTQFAQSGAALITIGTANPGFYAIGTSNFRYLNINMNNQNGGTVEVADNPGVGIEWDHVNLSINSATNNYLGMGFIPRINDSAGEAKYNFLNSLFNEALPSATPLPTPVIYAPPSQNGSGATQNSQAHFYFNNTNFSNSGFEWESCGGGPTFEVIGNRNVRQGGYMPLFTVGNCGGNATLQGHFSGITLDTDALGILNIVAPGGTFSGLLAFEDIFASADAPSGNGSTPLVTGQFVQNGQNPAGPNTQVVVGAGVLAGRAPTNTGYGSCPLVPNGPYMFCLNEPGLIQQPNGYWFSPLAVPTSVSGTAAAGGTIGSGTIQFQVTAVDINGKETMGSVISSGVTTSGTCPGSGNCTVNLTWNAPTTFVGALTYNTYACGISPLAACPAMHQLATGITGTSTSVTTLGAGSGPAIPTVTEAGQSEYGPSLMFVPEGVLNQLLFFETTAPSATAGYDVCYGDSTAHAVKCSFNNGSFFPLPQTICTGQIALTTGAINSGTRATNTLSCTGLSATTDTISCTFSGDTNAVTGYAPSASGGLTLKTWISAGTINIDQVNDTGGSITPGAATVNCKGLR